MPDTMKSTDIEDVLSSIRRLVSYEPSNLRPAVPAAPAQPERLVLTPALRVRAEPDAVPVKPVEVHAEKPEPEIAPEILPETLQDEAPNVVPAAFAHTPAAAAPREVTDMAPAPAPMRQSLEDRIADLEAAVSQAGDEWEPDGSEADANVYPTSYPVIEPPRRSRMTLSEPESARLTTPEPEPAADKMAPAPESGLATPEPVAAVPHPEKAAPEPQPAPLAVAPESAPAAPEPAPAPVANMSERIAEDVAEAAIEDIVLDTGVEDILERAEEAVVAATRQAPAAGIDQANLRELVRQIIREEFQGVLGERITRNVRKLVRREINRALVSKDFE